MTNPTEILAALNTIAAFVGEDSNDFQNAMIERRAANTLNLFATNTAAVEETHRDLSSKLSLRTEEARTDFDARVYGLIARRKGVEVSAATLIESYKAQRGFEPTAAQMRAALNRLIADGNVSYSGIQRGTKYSVA